MYQFNHMTQTFEEVKEATRFERLMRKPVSRMGIIKIGLGGLVVILTLGYIMITDAQERVEKVQHEYRMTHPNLYQGVSQ